MNIYMVKYITSGSITNVKFYQSKKAAFHWAQRGYNWSENEIYEFSGCTKKQIK